MCQLLSFAIGPPYRYDTDVIRQLTVGLYTSIIPVWDTEGYGPVSYVAYATIVYVTAAAALGTVVCGTLLVGRYLQSTMAEINTAVGIAAQCLSTWLYLPALHLFLAGLGCESNAGRLRAEGLGPNVSHVFHFKHQQCYGAFHVVTIVVAIVGIVALFSIGAVMTAMVGDVRLGAHHLRSRPHNQIELVHFLIITALAVAQHLLMPYGRQDAYSALVAVGMLLTTALHAYGVPFYNHSMNVIRTTAACATLVAAVVNLATAVWDTGLGRTSAFEAAQLNSAMLAALLPFGALLGYAAGDLRPCNELRGKLKMLLHTGLVPRHEALFPFPRSKLTYDLKFTSLRFQLLEGEILGEYEDVLAMGVGVGVGGGMSSGNTSQLGQSGGANATDFDATGGDLNNNLAGRTSSGLGGMGFGGFGGPSAPDFESAARDYRVATRCQILVPYIKQVRVPWDSEVSTRFVKMQSDVTGLPASPFVVAFAARIFIKCLLLWRTSGLVKCAFANFLFARSKRFRLALDLIEEVDGQIDSDHDIMTLYMSHKIGHEIRDLSGIRDDVRTMALNRARLSHKEALADMGNFWGRLMSARGDVVGLSLVCAQVTRRRLQAQIEYERFLVTQRPDGVVLNMYAAFLQHVLGDDMATDEFKALAAVAAEEKRQRILRRGGQSTVSASADTATSRAAAKLIDALHEEEDNDRRAHDTTFSATVSAKNLMRLIAVFLVIVAGTSITAFALQRVRMNSEAEAIRQTRRVGVVRSSVEKQRYLIMRANEEKLQCFVRSAESSRAAGATTASQANIPLLQTLVTVDPTATDSSTSSVNSHTTSSLLLCSDMTFLRSVKALSDEEVRMRGTFNVATIGSEDSSRSSTAGGGGGSNGAGVGRLAMQAATQRSVPLRSPLYRDIFNVQTSPFTVADAPGIAATVVRTGTFSQFSQSAANAVAIAAESPWISITAMSQKVTEAVNGMVAGDVYGDSFSWVTSADNVHYIVEGMSTLIRGLGDDVSYDGSALLGATIGLLCLALAILIVTYYAFYANMQRAAVDQTHRLQLFSLVPFNTQEELYLRARGALEAFERMTVEGGGEYGGYYSADGTSDADGFESDRGGGGGADGTPRGIGGDEGAMAGVAAGRANAVAHLQQLPPSGGQDPWGAPVTPRSAAAAEGGSNGRMPASPIATINSGANLNNMSTNSLSITPSKSASQVANNIADSRAATAAAATAALKASRQGAAATSAPAIVAVPTAASLSAQQQSAASTKAITTSHWLRATTAAGVAVNDATSPSGPVVIGPDGHHHNVAATAAAGGGTGGGAATVVDASMGARRMRMFQTTNVGGGGYGGAGKPLGNSGSGGTSGANNTAAGASTSGGNTAQGGIGRRPQQQHGGAFNTAPFGNFGPIRSILKRPHQALSLGALQGGLGGLGGGGYGHNASNPFGPYLATSPYALYGANNNHATAAAATAANLTLGGKRAATTMGIPIVANVPSSYAQHQPPRRRVHFKIDGEGILSPITTSNSSHPNYLDPNNTNGAGADNNDNGGGGTEGQKKKKPQRRLREKEQPIPEDIVADFENTLRQAQREVDEENERDRVRSEKVIFGGLRAYQMGRKRAVEIARQARESSHWDVSSLSAWVRFAILLPIVAALATAACGLSIATEVLERNVETVNVAAAATDMVSQLRAVRMETLYFLNSGRIEHYHYFMKRLQNRDFFAGPMMAVSKSKAINVDTATHIVEMQRIAERIIYDMVVAMCIGGRAIATSDPSENNRRGVLDIGITEVPILAGVSWISSAVDETFAKTFPPAVADPLAYAMPSLAVLRNNYVALEREKAYYDDLVEQWAYNNTNGGGWWNNSNSNNNNTLNTSLPVFSTRFRTLNEMLTMSLEAQANRSRATRGSNVLEEGSEEANRRGNGSPFYPHNDRNPNNNGTNSTTNCSSNSSGFINNLHNLRRPPFPPRAAIDDKAMLVDGAIISYLNMTNLVLADAEELLTFAKLRASSAKIDDDFAQLEQALRDLCDYHGFMKRYEAGRNVQEATVADTLRSSDSQTSNVDTAYAQYISEGNGGGGFISNAYGVDEVKRIRRESAVGSRMSPVTSISAGISTSVNGGIMVGRFGVGDASLMERFGSVQLPGIVSVGSNAYLTAQTLLIVGFALSCVALGILTVTMFVSVVHQLRRCAASGRFRAPSSIETTYLVFVGICLALMAVVVGLVGSTTPILFSVDGYLHEEVIGGLTAFEDAESRFFSVFVNMPSEVLTAPLRTAQSPLLYYNLYQQREAVGAVGTVTTTLDPIAGHGMMPWLSSLANKLEALADRTAETGGGSTPAFVATARSFRGDISSRVLPALAAVARIQDVGLYMKRCADVKWGAEDALLKNMSANGGYTRDNPPPVSVTPPPSRPFIADYNMASEPLAALDLNRFTDFTSLRYSTPAEDVIPSRSSTDLATMARAAVFGARGLWYLRAALATVRTDVFEAVLQPSVADVSHRADNAVAKLTAACGLLAAAAVVSVILFAVPWAMYIFTTRKGKASAKAAGLLEALFSATIRRCQLALMALTLLIATQFTLFFLADGAGADGAALVDKAYMRETLVAQCYADGLNLRASAHNGNVFEANARGSRLRANAEKLRQLRHDLYYREGALSGRYGRARALSDAQKAITYEGTQPLDRLLTGWIDAGEGLGASSNQVVRATAETNATRLAKLLLASASSSSIPQPPPAPLDPHCADNPTQYNLSYADCYPSLAGRNYSHIQSPDFLAPFTFDESYLAAVDDAVAEMGAAVAPLLASLRRSNKAFESDAHAAMDATLAPDIVMLVAVLLLIAAELQLVFRPIGDLLVSQEAGARLLLTMVPSIVRDLIPRVQLYLDTGDLSDTSVDAKTHERDTDTIEAFKAAWQRGDEAARCFAVLDRAAANGHTFVVISADGTVQHVNAAIEGLLGFTAADIVGQNVAEMMEEPLRGNHTMYIRRYLAHGVPRVVGTGRDTVALSRRGERVPVYLQVFDAVRDDGSMYFIGQMDRYVGAGSRGLR